MIVAGSVYWADDRERALGAVRPVPALAHPRACAAAREGSRAPRVDSARALARPTDLEGPCAVIKAEHLTKRFGKKVLAVDDVSFAIEPGTITGVLGPNGAGKTTTLRMILDLVRPTAGSVTILGSRYRDLHAPAATGRRAARLLRLPPRPLRPQRPARDRHRRRRPRRARRRDARAGRARGRRQARGQGLLDRHEAAPRARRRRCSATPRCSSSTSPPTASTPRGCCWLRTFLRELAAEGRTVLVSSHVLAEVEQTVDDVLIMSKGRLLAQGPIHELDRVDAAGGPRALAPGREAGGRAHLRRRGRQPPERRPRGARAVRRRGRRRSPTPRASPSTSSSPSSPAWRSSSCRSPARGGSSDRPGPRRAAQAAQHAHGPRPLHRHPGGHARPARRCSSSPSPRTGWRRTAWAASSTPPAPSCRWCCSCSASSA